MVKRFLGVTKGFIKSMNERHVTAYAAQAAYFIILSFIPFMLLLMTSVKYTPLTKEEVVRIHCFRYVRRTLKLLYRAL